MISVILEKSNLDTIRAEIVKTVKKALNDGDISKAEDELKSLLQIEAELKQVFDKAYEAAKNDAEPTFTRYTED